MQHQQKARYKRVPLSLKERRLWEDTLSALSWIAPGFIHVIYTMLHRSGNDDVALFTEDMSYAAATDGFQLIFKPSMFFKLPLMERVFAVLHEVMHEILNHCRFSFAFRQAGKITVNGKSLPYHLVYANIIQDLVINAILIAAKMGTFNKDWLFDAKLQAEDTTWVELYFRLWPKPKKGEEATLQVPGSQFDEHLEPFESEGIDPHEAPERNGAAWEIAVNSAAEIQRAQGKMPGALEHFFDMVLKPKIDWTEHVRGLLMRMTGSGGYDWRRLDRRLITRHIGAPSLTGFGAGLIIVGGDTSGSIFGRKPLLHRFVSEMAGMITDLNPEELHSVWCDTEVKRVDILHDPADLIRVIEKIPGGGGTDFRPVFDYVRKNGLEPDALIYLTDLAGSFPDREPDYPVIWGCIDEGMTAPFGTVVHIPKDTE